MKLLRPLIVVLLSEQQLAFRSKDEFAALDHFYTQVLIVEQICSKILIN